MANRGWGGVGGGWGSKHFKLLGASEMKKVFLTLTARKFSKKMACV
jgi:hypothetical protein